MKAFDSVHWSFSQNIFTAINIPIRFADWVFECISGARFSVALKGGSVGYFEGKKGLRQGDPLSPYLFVMAIQVLSKLLDSAAAIGRISYHPRCSKLALSHLGFANDLMIFWKGDLYSLRSALAVFDNFYRLSGLKLNPLKTEIFCAGMETSLISSFISISEFKLGSLPVRYLGVPLVPGRLTDRDCSRHLVEKITSWIDSWAARKLSYVGSFN